MSNFYFFTNLYLNGNVISSQDSSDAFGPIDDMNYRVCSLHNLPVNAKAYAICDGLIFAQKIPTTNELVVVLKPTKQPNSFNLGHIKFIIYRNIKQSSLINGNQIAAASNNDLTKAIWDSFQKLADEDDSINANDKPGVEALGIDLSTSGQDPLEDIFYLEDGRPFFSVNGGWHIGNFTGASKKAGLEIVIDTPGYEPKLETARQDDHTINITVSINNASSSQEKFWHWHQKEAVLNYLDPCAFYGSLIGEGIRLPELQTNPEDPVPLGNMDDIVSFFQNKNKAYLVINNNHQKSYNYYGFFDYLGERGKIMLNQQVNPLPAPIPSSLNPVDFYDEWPLYTIQVDLNNPDLYFYFSIPLRYKPASKDDTITSPRLFLQCGFADGVPFSAYPYEKRFYILGHEFDDSTNEYLTEVAVIWVSKFKFIPFTLGKKNDQGEIKFVPAYHKFVFHQHFFKIINRNNQGEIENSELRRSFLDNIFPITGMSLPIKRGNQETVSRIYNTNIITSFGFSEYGFNGVHKIGIAEDEKNYTFFAYPGNFHSSIKDIVKTPHFLMSRRIEDVDFLYSLSEENSYDLTVGQVDSWGGSKKVFQYQKLLLKEKASKAPIDLSKMHAIVISKTQYSQLEDKINEIINTIFGGSVEEGYLFYLDFVSKQYTMKNGIVAFKGGLAVTFYDPGPEAVLASPILPSVEVLMYTVNQ